MESSGGQGGGRQGDMLDTKIDRMYLHKSVMEEEGK